MTSYWSIGLLVTLLVGMGGATAKAEDTWKSYRNQKFGYELSYPANMEYTTYLDGSSGELKDARTGRTLMQFDVWPPGECPRQPAQTVARELGIERAKAVTQTDGPDGSSYCSDPVTVREHASRHGAKIYELVLTCVRETYPDSHDDTADVEPDPSPSGADSIVTPEGQKGPTYFLDISPPWSKRVLAADPAGVDPRTQAKPTKKDLAMLRKVLETVKTFPTQKPADVCIEELQNRGGTMGIPLR